MVKSFTEALLPVRITAIILGIFPFKFENQNVIFTIFKFIQGIIYLTIYIACFFTYYKNLNSILPGDFTKMNTILYAFKLKKLGNIVVMCVTLVTTLINRKRLLSVYRTICKVDLKLTLLGHKEEVCRSNQQHRRILIILVAALNIFYIIGTCVLFATKKNSFAVEFIANVFPLLVIANFNLTFYGTTTALQHRFQIINSRIFKMTKRIEDTSFRKIVEELIAIHQNLIKSSKDVNSVFSFHLLLWIGLTFMASVLALYVTVWLIVMNLVLKHPPIFINTIKCIFISFFDLFCFCHRSRQLCQEVSYFSSVNFTHKKYFKANNTKILLLEVQAKQESEEERNVVSFRYEM
jgi:hypothetical protein